MTTKPINDLILAIETSDFEKVKILLEKSGYYHRGDLGITGRGVLKMNEETTKDNIPRNHLYVCAKDNEKQKKETAFKDYLINHKSDAQRLGKLKWSLAERYNNDPEEYMKGKDALCKEITNKAMTKNIGKFSS